MDQVMARTDGYATAVDGCRPATQLPITTNFAKPHWRPGVSTVVKSGEHASTCKETEQDTNN